MPLTEYEQTVERVNVGYDLLFTLTYSFLKGLHQPELELLVVGAGGGAEVERFAAENPGWRLTGVDPSSQMLEMAQIKTDRLGLQERVTLLPGTIDVLPNEAQFDVAVCLFVLHFLSDDAKSLVLRQIASHLKPGAPLFVAAGVKPDDQGLSEDFLAAWQQYGEMMGMPPERMTEIIAQLMAQPMASEEDYVRRLHEAGFKRVAEYFNALGGILGWIAR
jgi:tRNA (cmo5U34)-methyltransferase